MLRARLSTQLERSVRCKLRSTALAIRCCGDAPLFRAKSLEKQSREVETSIANATFAMASGLGFAFLGLAPLTSPNMFMIGLLLAIVQVQFGYSFLMRSLWMQRRRWVVEVHQDKENHVVTVVCDGRLTRTWTLTSENATGDKPSMQDISEKGQSFFFLDKSEGEVLADEALEKLLRSPQGIESEEVKVEPVMGETEDQSLRIVQSFTKLSRSHLKQLEGKDGGSPPQQLDTIDRYAKFTGLGFMSMGLFIYVAGNWSAQNIIDRAAETYKSNAMSETNAQRI